MGVWKPGVWVEYGCLETWSMGVWKLGVWVSGNLWKPGVLVCGARAGRKLQSTLPAASGSASELHEERLG